MMRTFIGVPKLPILLCKSVKWQRAKESELLCPAQMQGGLAAISGPGLSRASGYLTRSAERRISALKRGFDGFSFVPIGGTAQFNDARCAVCCTI